MASENPIVFYDIASKEPRTTFAANPWKTRLALNYKGVPFRTEWVEMPDIQAVREKLGVPANRTHPDGTPYHTLPVISDPSTGTLLGDTFEIALYLDEAYPDQPRLIQPQTTGLTAAFNAHIDTLFTNFASMCTQMPFDPNVLPVVMGMFAKRLTGVKLRGEIQAQEKSHEEMLEAFEAKLGELSKAYRHTGGTTDHFWLQKGTNTAQAQRGPAQKAKVGPFLDGDLPSYSDFIVAAWLKMFQISLPSEDWERIKTWHGGLWASIVAAVDEWAVIR